MRRTSFAAMDCSVAQALEIVGEWWSLLILRDAFQGIRRFEAFQRRLGIAGRVRRIGASARAYRRVGAGAVARGA